VNSENCSALQEVRRILSHDVERTAQSLFHASEPLHTLVFCEGISLCRMCDGGTLRSPRWTTRMWRRLRRAPYPASAPTRPPRSCYSKDADEVGGPHRSKDDMGVQLPVLVRERGARRMLQNSRSLTFVMSIYLSGLRLPCLPRAETLRCSRPFADPSRLRTLSHAFCPPHSAEIHDRRPTSPTGREHVLDHISAERREQTDRSGHVLRARAPAPFQGCRQ
jgi:hypothetical protein